MAPTAVSDPPPAPRPGPRPSRWESLRRRGHRHRRPLTVLAVVALLAQMAAAMVTAAVQQSPTIDEPVYVGAAVVYTRHHSLRPNPEHPPLGKLVIGAGLAFADPRLDPAASTAAQGALGRRLLYESGNDPQRVLLAARLPMIVLTLLFGLVVFAFAADLTGRAGGLAALALYAFSPDVIAHGSLATLDVPAAGLLLTSAWLLWRARRRPVLYLPPAGAAVGAALATKMSALAAVPVVAALAVLSVRVYGRRRRSGAPGAGGGSGDHDRAGGEGEGEEPRSSRAVPARLLAAGGAAAVATLLVAVAVVWASYLAVDPRLRWSAPPGTPAVDGLRELAADWLPFPRPYRDGMRLQWGFEDMTWGGFLFGHQYSGSRWYYLPAALLVKTPLGTLALWAGGAAAMVAVRRLRPAAPYVLVPAAVLLGAAMTGSRDLGVRYAIAVPLFLAVAAAGTTAVRRRGAGVAVAALAGLVAVSSLRAFPYYLPYSNEAFGGPSKTHLHLHDSNVDWGQDLGRLADRLRTRYRGERIWLVYKGGGVPSHYGIRARDPLGAAPERVRGLLVVSDSAAAKARGRLAALIRSSEPIDTVGHSITIYRRGGG